MTSHLAAGRVHLTELRRALVTLEPQLPRLQAWGTDLASRLSDGGRLLAAGNGGSAAHAQHLTAELVGRYQGERLPMSAIALHADTSSVTAIVNDYGPDAVFARQVAAHGRAGDVLLLFSTSGSSANVVRAASIGRDQGLTVWAVTGPLPNPLASGAHDVVAVPAKHTPTVQEVHQVVVHLVCGYVDAALEPRASRSHREGQLT
ncbi:MAG: SIS domain-containing protein [Acidimicrobiia bacterium]